MSKLSEIVKECGKGKQISVKFAGDEYSFIKGNCDIISRCVNWEHMDNYTPLIVVNDEDNLEVALWA